MEKMNVMNIKPYNLYKFANNHYIWKIILRSTRNGNYVGNKYKDFTEVYKIDENGLMTKVASGYLINNPNTFDYNKEFAIFDYDQCTSINFNIEMPLIKANVNELKLLREEIAREYKSKKKMK